MRRIQPVYRGWLKLHIISVIMNHLVAVSSRFPPGARRSRLNPYTQQEITLVDRGRLICKKLSNQVKLHKKRICVTAARFRRMLRQ